MPTILLQNGWRLFFYANEGDEPIHVHCRKADMECKFWLQVDTFEVQEEYAYGLTPSERRAVREIIFEHFDYLVEKWVDVHKRLP